MTELPALDILTWLWGSGGLHRKSCGGFDQNVLDCLNNSFSDHGWPLIRKKLGIRGEHPWGFIWLSGRVLFFHSINTQAKPLWEDDSIRPTGKKMKLVGCSGPAWPPNPVLLWRQGWALTKGGGTPKHSNNKPPLVSASSMALLSSTADHRLN